MAKHRPYPELREGSMLSYTQEGQDQIRYEQQVWREEELLIRQQEQIEWLQETERKNQIQKDIDRKSDRRFLWIVTLISAIIGAVIGSIVTIAYEAFFK